MVASWYRVLCKQIEFYDLAHPVVANEATLYTPWQTFIREKQHRAFRFWTQARLFLAILLLRS